MLPAPPPAVAAGMPDQPIGLSFRMVASTVIAWTLPLIAVAASEDPRIRLVELQSAGRQEAALEETERLRREQPDVAAGYGLCYLEGRLLEELGRLEDASEAFATCLTETPDLEPWARHRLALAQTRLGAPEIAAGVSATLLSNRPPRVLIRPAAELLAASLDRGGDCRLLGGIPVSRMPATERRLLSLSRAKCRLAAGELEEGTSDLVALLEERSNDVVAFEAAERLHALRPDSPNPQELLLLGTTFHDHRAFDRSNQLLGQIVVDLEVRTNADFEIHYRWARSHFWQGRLEDAARHYEVLATNVNSARYSAQALYHKGRSEELSGDWESASNTFRRAYLAQPQGNFAAAALLGAMRLDWRRGLEDRALELYSILLELHSDRGVVARGSLFLAVSDIAQGRLDRAGAWLADAERASRSVALEVRYWRGRLLEARGGLDRAIEHYVDLLAADPYHPLAQEADKRLAAEPLRVHARRLAGELERSGNPAMLYRAWLLHGRRGDDAEAARQALQGRLVADAGVRSFLALRGVPPDSWPLWTQSASDPQELMLALGLWGDAVEVVNRHFPVANPRLALTATAGLARSRPRRALLIAEILAQRAPSRVPEPLHPLTLRQALFPRAYGELIDLAATRRGLNPFLMAAIMRQESRFDHQAVSAASARGLMQFVYPTAARLAASAGRPLRTPRDLEDPALAIELGAAYLAELSALFGNEQHIMVAAYNAGEAQAGLWRRHCYTNGADEYFTKVGFSETRNYLEHVLHNVAHYHDLYDPAA